MRRIRAIFCSTEVTYKEYRAKGEALLSGRVSNPNIPTLEALPYETLLPRTLTTLGPPWQIIIDD